MTRASDGAARDRTALAKRRFLVVDDHSYMIEVISEVLRHFSAEEISRAESVEMAMSRFGPHAAFDCVICDFNMKPVNGIQFLQAIRAGKLPFVKRDQHFVLLTGHGDMDVVKAAKALDVSGYAVKPVAPDTFIKTVTRALGTTLTLKSAEEYAKVPTADLKRFQ
jgi:DNA-binding NarL/FixJ family response regulator